MTQTTTELTTTSVDREKDEKEDVDIEFAKWQANIGPLADINALKSALRPIERFAFQFHTDIEPFYSIYYIQEQQRLLSLGITSLTEADSLIEVEEWDIERIEREREEDEYKALAEGILASQRTLTLY